MASSATHGEVQQDETKKVCSVIGMCKVHIKVEPELYTSFPFFLNLTIGRFQNFMC